MDFHEQGGGPGYRPAVDDQGELPTCSYHATAKALTQGKSKFRPTIETVSQATEMLISYISALDDQDWDVKQEFLSDWLKEKEGSERTWPTAFHGKKRWIDNERNGKRRYLSVSVVEASVDEFERDHSAKNVGRFVVTTRMNNDLHCMYASKWEEGKIICMNSWGPKRDPDPSVEKGKNVISISNFHILTIIVKAM